ncbi:MAG: hypothetical protein GX492_11450 [Firmicutes bacterium]|nr:hypothetical protein [Bacillota bacterium]
MLLADGQVGGQSPCAGHRVVRSNRQAVYDGVIIYEPDLIIIIEAKLDSNGFSCTQLDPGTDLDPQVSVNPVPVILQWKDIFERLISLITRRQVVCCAEKRILDDFLAYVDQYFPHLGPYANFSLCGGNEYRLLKRCRKILANVGQQMNLQLGSQTDPPFLDLSSLRVGAIATRAYLGPEFGQGRWVSVKLSLYAGDTVTQAKEFYNSVSKSKVQLFRNGSWETKPNLHFGYIRRHLVWSSAQIQWDDYYDYWYRANQNGRIRQYRQPEFTGLFDQLLCDKQITNHDRAQLDQAFVNTNRDHVNVCPGMAFVYTWDAADASHLDNQGSFESDVRHKLDSAMRNLP